MPELLELPTCFIATPQYELRHDDDSEPRSGSCGWMCQVPRCFSACTRESVHPGNHFCGGGHTY
jgi:hypothetical protein